MGETNNGVEVARPWQRVIERFEQEGILASPANKQICSSAANDSVIAITPTEIIGKARAGDGVGTAAAIDKTQSSDRGQTAQVKCVGSPSAHNTLTIALPRLNRRGRGVEAGKCDIARAGH